MEEHKLKHKHKYQHYGNENCTTNEMRAPNAPSEARLARLPTADVNINSNIKNTGAERGERSGAHEATHS